MKLKFGFITMLVAALFFATACSDDDETVPGGGPSAEDGWYLSGDASALGEYSQVSVFKTGVIEGPGYAPAPRATLYTKYVALKGGKSISVTKVDGGVATQYGAGTDVKTYNPEAADNQINADVTTGALTAGASVSIANDGLYQVAFDTELNKFWVVKVSNVEISQGNVDLPMKGAFSQDQIVYEGTNVLIAGGDFKFRHSHGWKLLIDTIADPQVAIFSNWGTAVDPLVEGGTNISGYEGYYTATFTWSASDCDFTASLVKTGDYTSPIPDELYLVGNALATGWTEPGTDPDAIMYQIPSGADGAQPVSPGLFWKIVSISDSVGGRAFRVNAPTWNGMKIKFTDVKVWDATGVEVVDMNDGDHNWCLKQAGVYIVVVDINDMSNAKVSIKPAEVYGMGDAFGGWTEDAPANLFTIDNTAQTLVSPALSAAGNVRMYAQHSWIPQWWAAEWIVKDGAIVYRGTGGDQEAIAGTAGQVVTLHFDDNTGSIQ